MGETGVVRSSPLLRPGTESNRMVPITTPRRCRATITGLASLSHRGNLPASAIVILSTLILLSKKGAPLREAAQRPRLHVLYEPTHPLQLGLSQHQLVLRLHEEETGQVVPLPDIVEPGSHLPGLRFQPLYPLLQKRHGLLGRYPGQVGETGRDLRVLLDRLPQQLA